MTPHEFVQKWRGHKLSERAAAQEHFIDLCRLFGHPTPAEADRRGEEYAFEKGVTKTGGGDGFADVWKRGFFAWEYKKLKRNLDVALEQLTRYASALENPPLHVACDTENFKIVTAWTNTVPKTYTLSLEDLLDADKRKILHSVFHDPERLKPQRTRAQLTAEAAKKFFAVAEGLQHRNPDKEAVAHFVNQLVFCFFAEDTKLLPDDYFTKLLRSAARRPDDVTAMLDGLFAAMDKGTFHGVESIAHFNGGLFDGRGALKLSPPEIDILTALGSMEWDQIDPTIFGTLFERFLDPDKRAQIGAHYTDPEKIMMIVEPVVVRPLTAEWEAVKARIAGLLDGSIKPPRSTRTGKALKPQDAAEGERAAFLDRLRGVTILDPACGSGNFLYLALHAVKDIENRVVLETEALGLPNTALLIGPEVVKGIELNAYAAELARTTIWIGYLQWKIRNGILAKDDPILKRLDNIECRDALVSEVREGGATQFVEAEWPAAEFIVGNPPFLGGKLLRNGLGNESVDRLFSIFDARVPHQADLVCYWFEKARAAIAGGRTRAAGLVSTNSIRGGANRRVLERLMDDATIFEAWSDEPWIVDGAAVRVSLVCFREAFGTAISPLEGEMPGRAEGGRGHHQPPPSGLPPISPSRGEIAASAYRLDGQPVAAIFADLTASASDLTKALRLKENTGMAFQGIIARGPFDVDGMLARSWLSAPTNPNARPNSDILFPISNGADIAGHSRDNWVIDLSKYDEKEAALYGDVFEHIRETARAARENVRDRADAMARWWGLWRPRNEMRAALGDRYVFTPRVSKHRIFVLVADPTLPDDALIAIARDDETSFGILHSRYHEAWSLRLGTWLGVGNDPRYTPTTTFETFPFPEGLTPNIPAATYAGDPRAARIATAARTLDEKRRAWLNPPDLVEIVPEITPTAAPGEEPRKYPDRILPRNAEAAAKLKERTLTNLYNQRPQWPTCTTRSTGRSPPPMAGRKTFPLTRLWRGCSRSIWSARRRGGDGGKAMTRNQLDLFGNDQPELFDAEAAPVVYRADPDRIRRRIANIIAEARAAERMPWNAEELGNRAYLLRQMSRFLPEDEAAQLAFAFEQEVERLKAA
ncbi:MAG: class I SAM-dependent DNA methyltransferase [Rhizobiaceae bacterium]